MSKCAISLETCTDVGNTRVQLCYTYHSSYFFLVFPPPPMKNSILLRLSRRKILPDMLTVKKTVHIYLIVRLGELYCTPSVAACSLI